MAEPKTITIDRSIVKIAAISGYNADHETGIEIRQCKYLTDVFDKTFLGLVVVLFSPCTDDRVA